MAIDAKVVGIHEREEIYHKVIEANCVYSNGKGCVETVAFLYDKISNWRFQ